AVLALLLILGHLVAKGASSLDWSFFVKNPVPAGQAGGGVANAIVGTVIVVGVAALIGLPIGIGTGLYLAEYGSGRLGWVVRFVADVLNGTPSIVVGIFAWTWLVKPMGGFSALAGSVALAALMVPMQTLSLQIFVYATGPFDEWHRLAWAAALVLMGLVLLLALAARAAVRQRHGTAR